MRVVWVVATLALLATSSQATDVERVFTPSFHATDSAATGALDLLDFRVSDAEAASARFELNTTQLVLETDSVQYLQAGVTAVGTQAPRTDRQEFVGAVVQGMVHGGQTGLFVVPIGPTTVSFGMSDADVGLPVEKCRAQPVYFARDRPVLCPNLTDSIAISGSLADEVIFTGNFQMFLWGWGGTVDSDQGRQTFWSGQQNQVPSPADAGPTELRHVVMTVNGELRVTFSLEQPIEVLASTVFLKAAEVVIPAHDGEISVSEGTLQVSRSGPLLENVVSAGTLTQPDGTSVTIGPSTQSRSSLPWLLAIAGLVVFAPIGVMTGRATSARVHLRYARDNLALGNFHSAARHAEAALVHRKSRIEGGILGTIALIRANDLQDARDFLEILRQIRRPDRAATAYLEACIEAASGNRGLAQRLLANAIDANPAYEAEATANPILQGIPIARGRPTATEAYA